MNATMVHVEARPPNLRFQIAAFIAVAAAATIAGAWIFQAFGYQPCELCLKQRYAYYGGVPLAALVAYAARGPARGIVFAGMIGLALIFAANAALGVYHAGVEWRFWAGPSSCTGVIAGPPNVADLMKHLENAKVVACDEVQLRILGLSLAGWNALISAALAALALRGAAVRG
ncbi:MAG TPA: disulfide bond formation protein B [Roseiarcus sp.]|nr:disulfide bond formation protein B [Roseiarcus sp.]